MKFYIKEGCKFMEIIYKDWDLFLKIAEYPFIRQDMTLEEFDEELKYLGEHYEDYRNGNYLPLWKQK